MTKTIKTVGAVVASVMALAIFVYGWTNVRTSATAAARNLGREIEEAKPDVQLYAEIQVGLEDFDQQIRDYESRLSEVERKREDTSQQLTQLRRQLKNERRILAQAKTLLDEDHEYHFVNTRRYSRSEIHADALVRLEHCQQLDGKVRTVTQSLAQLDTAIAESRRILTEAQTARSAKLAELQTLQARLENAKLLDQVHELTDSMRISPRHVETELARRFDRFEERVERAERGANKIGPVSAAGAGTIVWEEPVDDELGERIANFLESSPDEAGSYLGNPEVY